MDDTAQSSNVPTQPADATTQQVQPMQPAPATPVARPVQPPPSVGRSVEQGPVRSGPPQREAAPIDEADAVPPAASDDSSDVVDDQVDAKQPAEQQAAPEAAVEAQDSHPVVEVSEELQQADVKAGLDANKEQLPEEQQAVEIPETPEAKQAAAQQTIAASLPIDYVQAVQLKKTSKIRDSAKWFADMVKRQWEVLQGKPK